MLRTRVIPCLLLENGGLVKSVRFKDPKYVGDPINAVRIFNEKEVDEIVFLDISATPNKREPDFDLISQISSEAFVPFSYGGGITKLDQIKRLFYLGVEKVVLNSVTTNNPDFISQAAEIVGRSSIVVSIDVRKNWLGKYTVFSNGGQYDTKKDPVEHAKEMVKLGAGEVLINSIECDGTMTGYDLSIISKITEAVPVPVVALGGAGNLKDFCKAIEAGASAVAAGSFFVFHGKHKAVLITYPKYEKLMELLN